MTAAELFTKVIEKAKEFGMVPKNDGRTIIEPKGNAIIRNNLLDVSFSDGSAFFAIISGEEETSGPYSDYSFVVFPEKELGVCIVGLVVGSQGFKNDYQLASMPGLRRSFLKLRTEDDTTFFKTSFDDIESSSSDLLNEVKANYPGLRKVVEDYRTVHPACCIVNFDDPEVKPKALLDTIFNWLATYAKMRGWGNKAQQKKIEEALEKVPAPIIPDEYKEVANLLQKRQFVVLQGAPGTGKTYTALKIADKEYDHSFFVQFHAETTFSDFVYGLEPDMEAEFGGSQFKPKEGILYQAIEYAQEHEDENVLLIIDEINRANLSNVLGPVFYLFEYQTGKRKVEISVGDLSLTQLPENLDVLATMNTADRSLAVVDFALRRRFAWYTLKPHKVAVDRGKKFMEKIFNKFADIFFEYATDEELNLQPGQSYFIVDSDDAEEEMKDRLIYELMPLIKEYLAEGYLLKARDSFSELFLKETGKLLYE